MTLVLSKMCTRHFLVVAAVILTAGVVQGFTTTTTTSTNQKVDTRLFFKNSYLDTLSISGPGTATAAPPKGYQYRPQIKPKPKEEPKPKTETPELATSFGGAKANGATAAAAAPVPKALNVAYGSSWTPSTSTAVAAAATAAYDAAAERQRRLKSLNTASNPAGLVRIARAAADASAARAAAEKAQAAIENRQFIVKGKPRIKESKLQDELQMNKSLNAAGFLATASLYVGLPFAFFALPPSLVRDKFEEKWPAFKEGLNTAISKSFLNIDPESILYYNQGEPKPLSQFMIEDVPLGLGTFMERNTLKTVPKVDIDSIKARFRFGNIRSEKTITTPIVKEAVEALTPPAATKEGTPVAAASTTTTTSYAGPLLDNDAQTYYEETMDESSYMQQQEQSIEEQMNQQQQLYDYYQDQQPQEEQPVAYNYDEESYYPSSDITAEYAESWTEEQQLQYHLAQLEEYSSTLQIALGEETPVSYNYEVDLDQYPSSDISSEYGWTEEQQQPAAYDSSSLEMAYNEDEQQQQPVSYNGYDEDGFYDYQIYDQQQQQETYVQDAPSGLVLEAIRAVAPTSDEGNAYVQQFMPSSSTTMAAASESEQENSDKSSSSSTPSASDDHYAGGSGSSTTHLGYYDHHDQSLF